MTPLQEKFLGKKVLVICDSVFQKNVRWIGVCSFIGINEFLNKKQITIDRTPLFLKDFDQVSLYVETT